MVCDSSGGVYLEVGRGVGAGEAGGEGWWQVVEGERGRAFREDFGVGVGVGVDEG